ncbi:MULTISPECIES: hypothetical protein [Yersinia]|uniref:Type IV / VI secretion system DotU domain-containing protein n=1 Tax=Yersinia intermedia TaxID=631 RepID=A0A0T9N3Q2_YERIN|nr:MULTISPECIES: hypothetical protein [Yersinia]AJJ17178.1 hypothetical protein CH53_2537 [Yersinia intermedia]ARB86389.1 hypothetical protein A6J67_22170 [Yersinia sp. FDAARGOS_228]AVL36245.1 hypothetical protein CEQ36_11870 [Yersinia intermedia]MCB5300295.1 hypothetical protein [Yersinia intermedia]MDN0117203.1 hypothetical protein [Yersinia intermedia]
MKSEDIFKQILIADTLLSFNGIIPSLSDFQEKLITLITEFSQTLKSEQHPPIEVDRLCHQLCHYLDKRIDSTIKDKGLNWDSYLLLDYFYGYSTPLPTDHASLEALLNSDDKIIYHYAFKVLLLSRNLPVRDMKSQQLIARYSHKFLSLNLAVADDKIDVEPELVEVAPPIKEPVKNVFASVKRSSWRSLSIALFALALLLSAFWFWCSRYLGDMS